MRNIFLQQNYFLQDGLVWVKQKAASQDFSALILALLLHLSLIFFLFFQYQKASYDQTLSFSMTVMDLSSSSSNVVASSASAASKSSSKVLQKNEQQDAVAQSAEVVAQEMKNDDSKNSKTNEAFNSMQQNAVLAPDVLASVDAANMSNAAPKYPAISRRLGEEGLVIVKVFVSDAGEAKIVELKKSSGFGRLDNAAVETVKNWRFLAAKKGGKLVASWIHIPVRFALE